MTTKPTTGEKKSGYVKGKLGGQGTAYREERNATTNNTPLGSQPHLYIVQALTTCPVPEGEGVDRREEQRDDP
eukprot:3566095-Heterocapsa_arctica.AAC.1